jgi:hypothetical protein
MVLCGCVPRRAKRLGAPRAGPPGWGGFDQIDGEERTSGPGRPSPTCSGIWPVGVRVDPDRIGITDLLGRLSDVHRASVDALQVRGAVYAAASRRQLHVADTFAKMGKDKSRSG